MKRKGKKKRNVAQQRICLTKKEGIKSFAKQKQTYTFH